MLYGSQPTANNLMRLSFLITFWLPLINYQLVNKGVCLVIITNFLASLSSKKKLFSFENYYSMYSYNLQWV